MQKHGRICSIHQEGYLLIGTYGLLGHDASRRNMYWARKDGRDRMCLLMGDNVSVGWIIYGLLVRLMECMWVEHGLYSVVPKTWGNVRGAQWLKKV